MEVMQREAILWLDSVSKDDVGKVGGKCANVGEMLKFGIPVPPGFAVTTTAYDEFLVATGAAKEIEAYLTKFPKGPKTLSECEEVSQRLNTIIESKEMPKKLAGAICEAYRDLSKQTEGIAVSVRSSGVAEDMPGASFAGQYESYLNVKGEEELVEKVRSCWASMFTTRGITYRMRFNMGVLAGSICVLVMKMVSARSAGVAFTADTLTGDRTKIVIDANWGVGESVVQGIVNPDRYIIDKAGLRLVEKVINKKVMCYSIKERGTQKEEISADRQAEPCLSDEEVIKIAEMAKTVEEHYGVPQDIEWAVDSDFLCPHNVFLVQTRPITALSERDRTTEVILALLLNRVHHVK
jgi:pyruvate,water dikinase